MKSDKKKYQDNLIKHSYLVIPLALIIFLVPLIVYLKPVNLKGTSYEALINPDVSYDLFSYYKVIWLLILTTFALITLFIKSHKNNFKIKKTYLYIPMGIYSIFTLLSGIFSKYRNIAFGGFVERYEGTIVLIAYMAILFVAINILENEKHIKLIIGALIGSAFIIGIIGLFQYFNHDFFKTDLAKHIILPPEYQAPGTNFKFADGSNFIYSTLYHYNYVGSYMAMLFPLSLTIFFFVKKIKYKAFLGALTLLMFINWIACKSRAGVVGGILALIVLLIMLRKRIFKNWKVISCSALLLVLIFLALNRASLGSLKNKLLTFYIDPSAAVSTNQIEDITISKGRLNIAAKDYPITVEVIGENLRFSDKYGMDIPNELKEGKITFKDDNYKNYSFDLKQASNGIFMGMHLNNMKANFLITNEGIKALNYMGTPIDIKKVEAWGFEGKETLGSARGYVWSRALPLLKKTLILGTGADTFAIYFPQNDFVGKLKAYGTTSIFVDKPHDLYLQVGINTGIISLLAMISIFLIYMLSSIKLYINSNFDNTYKAAGAAIFIAVCGYLAAAFFNDSVVSVAPVFWILMGMGESINLKLKDAKQ